MVNPLLGKESSLNGHFIKFRQVTPILKLKNEFNQTKMTQTSIIAGRLREVLLNGHWIANTNFKEQILSVHWQQAIHKTENLNSIAALTFHINYYLSGLLHAFETGKLEIRDQFSFDCPDIQSETEWHNLFQDFLQNSEKFAETVERMRDNQLEKTFIDEKYGTLRRNIEGVIEHCYYHLGQVVLIRKITDAKKK